MIASNMVIFASNSVTLAGGNIIVPFYWGCIRRQTLKGSGFNSGQFSDCWNDFPPWHLRISGSLTLQSSAILGYRAGRQEPRRPIWFHVQPLTERHRHTKRSPSGLLHGCFLDPNPEMFDYWDDVIFPSEF